MHPLSDVAGNERAAWVRRTHIAGSALHSVKTKWAWREYSSSCMSMITQSLARTCSGHPYDAGVVEDYITSSSALRAFGVSQAVLQANIYRNIYRWTFTSRLHCAMVKCAVDSSDVNAALQSLPWKGQHDFGVSRNRAALRALTEIDWRHYRKEGGSFHGRDRWQMDLHDNLDPSGRRLGRGIAWILYEMGDNAPPVQAQQAAASPTTASGTPLPTKTFHLTMQTFPATPTDAWMAGHNYHLDSSEIPAPDLHTDWVRYGPSTNIVLPAHALVTMTIENYDGQSPVLNPFVSNVQGTVGNAMTVNGKTVNGPRPECDLAHVYHSLDPQRPQQPWLLSACRF